MIPLLAYRPQGLEETAISGVWEDQGRQARMYVAAIIALRLNSELCRMHLGPGVSFRFVVREFRPASPTLSELNHSTGFAWPPWRDTFHLKLPCPNTSGELARGLLARKNTFITVSVRFKTRIIHNLGSIFARFTLRVII